MRKSNTESFIQAAKKIHGDKYDYSKVIYKKAIEKVCIICPEHGEFRKTPNKHLQGQGCPQCSIERIKEKQRLGKEEFITKAKEKHGDKYDYSKVDYVNCSTKVIIICPTHGEFKQQPESHLQGCGCPRCTMPNAHLTADEFVVKAKIVHRDKYDYSKTVYKNNSTKVTIICPIHGEFKQKPINHLSGRGCPECGKESIGNHLRSTTEKFIVKAKDVHGNKYDYSKVEYVKASKKVCIICPEHGEFWKSPNKHLSGQGCPQCSIEKAKEKQRLGKEEFVAKARAVHGDKYDYSKVVYERYNKKVVIICPIHGEVEQTPATHLSGSGCPKCGKDVRRESKDGFVTKARAVHGDKYDYSKVEYVNSYTAVTIICPIHGEFLQVPAHHLAGEGCPQCRIDRRRGNKEEFIAKAKVLHGDKYDYSKVEYVNNYTPVTIICPIHGRFKQTRSSHLSGTGCPRCASPNRNLTTEEFIAKAREMHGYKYDYSKVVYKGVVQKLTIICPEHGEFEQSPTEHLAGSGCSKCFFEKYSKSVIEKSASNFTTRARAIHGDKYDYSKVEYRGCDNKVVIICPTHGEFYQTPSIHLRGSGCPKCSESRLERDTICFLESKGIRFEFQKTFDWLIMYRNMSLDFYLPEYNIGIECQGRQHFEPVDYFGGEEGLKDIQDRDNLKKELCEAHGIRLLYYSDLNMEFPYMVYEDLDALYNGIVSNSTETKGIKQLSLFDLLMD